MEHVHQQQVQKAQLWGTERLPLVLQTTGGNIDIECLEITDHSSCIYSGPIDGNVDGFPVQCVRTVSPDSGPWAHDGIEMAGTIENMLFRNLDVHGMGRYGIQIGTDSGTDTFGNLTFDNVKSIAKRMGRYSNSSKLYFRYHKISSYR